MLLVLSISIDGARGAQRISHDQRLIRVYPIQEAAINVPASAATRELPQRLAPLPLYTARRPTAISSTLYLLSRNHFDPMEATASHCGDKKSLCPFGLPDP